MIDYLRQLTSKEVWIENTRAMLAGNADGVADTAMVLLSRTDMSPEVMRRSREECAERATDVRARDLYQEAPATS